MLVAVASLGQTPRPAGDAPRLRLQAAPRDSLADAPIRILASGIPPGRFVTVRVQERTEMWRSSFQSGIVEGAEPVSAAMAVPID